MKVILLRGASGAGKSTYIKNNLPNAYVASADHYFQKDGTYKFDPNQLGMAHKWCMRSFIAYLSRADKDVAVDNTNITTLEWFPYYRVAEAFCAEFSIVELVPKDASICIRNIHGVPFETIKRMASNFEQVPNRYKIKVTRIEV